jgi:quinol monooxygenase YgiN
MTTSLTAEFRVLPGHEAQVRELVTELTAHVRSEPGNLLFLPHVREDDPRHYVVFEEYVDDAAFRSHLAQEHGRVFNATVAPLIEGGSSSLTMLTSIVSEHEDAR